MLEFTKKIKMRYVISIAFFFTLKIIQGQDSYFQQEVNYRIDVRLNDSLHSITAYEEIQYTNNSPASLDTIFFHLWPNAYKNNSTELAKQLIKTGNTSLFFSEENERGYIDSLDFKINGKSVNWFFHKEHIDICYLVLNEPLLSGATIKISTPFYVKIPDAKFSRLGHTGQAYFITQWYPKPAVYDKTGWHAFPYLDQGEFYSEYGSFDVHITLPDNYLLAATGDRIDAEEENTFLNSKVQDTKDHIEKNTRYQYGMKFPPSSTKLKTVRFKQYRVHDFAWFADKRFYVLKDQIELPETKRLVDTYVFFTDKNFDLWKSAVTYVNESTIFYSYLLGDYPYNHVTAVDGTIMAGGGMEYPNITVIGDMGSAFELDMVITHEVGHNWFYGILGSNERDHPFMDEGLNSLYELRYVRAKYGEEKLSKFIGRDSTFKLFGLNKYPLWKYHELSYFSAMRKNADQILNLKSVEFSEGNYGSIVYSKSAIIFDYLLYVYGEATFDRAMKLYFANFKFKHPQPEDLFTILREATKQDFNWFEKNLFGTRKKIDFKIKSASQDQAGFWTVKVKDKTKSGAPIVLQGYNNGKLAVEVMGMPTGKTTELGLPPTEIDKLIIDAPGRIPEINRKNNIYRTDALFKRTRPIHLNFLTALEDPTKNQINYLPLVGFNKHNGFMLGLSIHNYGIYAKKFDYMLAPFYGFYSNSPGGFLALDYNIYPEKYFSKVSVGLKAKSFAFDYFSSGPQLKEYSGNTLNYYKLSPHLIFDFKKHEATSKVNRKMEYVYNTIWTEWVDVQETGPTTFSFKKRLNNFQLNQISYNEVNERIIDPYSFNVTVQQTKNVSKIYGVCNYNITTSASKAIEIRLFAGTFLSGENIDRSVIAFRASGYNGWHDYLYEGNFMDRSFFPAPFAFSQFMERDGAMKIWSPFGQTTEWLVSLNIKSPRLFKTPLKFFGDIVACDGRALNTDMVLWNAGVNFALWKNIIDIYVPLIYSRDIRNALELNSVQWHQRIRFTFNIHKLDPKSILHNDLF